MRHTVFRDKACRPRDGNTHLQPLVDPTLKPGTADGEELGAIVKNALAEVFILYAARSQPSTDAPPLIQHCNLDALSLQNGGSNQPGQTSAHDNACLVFWLHVHPFPGAWTKLWFLVLVEHGKRREIQGLQHHPWGKISAAARRRAVLYEALPKLPEMPRT
jgi:hypothetical protein